MYVIFSIFRYYKKSEKNKNGNINKSDSHHRNREGDVSNFENGVGEGL